jgi:hypothetical protein
VCESRSSGGGKGTSEEGGCIIAVATGRFHSSCTHTTPIAPSFVETRHFIVVDLLTAKGTHHPLEQAEMMISLRSLHRSVSSRNGSVMRSRCPLREDP